MLSSFSPHVIPRGNSGLVYRTSPNRALKCALCGRASHVKHERRVLDRLGEHPQIVRSFEAEHDARISLEYHPCNLREYLAAGSTVQFWKWAHQVARGVTYLHSQDVIHLDLSPRNILVTADGNVVLCDFAASSLSGEWLGQCEGDVRFYRRRPGSKPEQQHDVFALGGVLYELLTREAPYMERTDSEVRLLYRDGIFPPMDHLPIGDIISNCWTGKYRAAAQVLFALEQRCTILHKAYTWLYTAHVQLLVGARDGKTGQNLILPLLWILITVVRCVIGSLWWLPRG